MKILGSLSIWLIVGLTLPKVAYAQAWELVARRVVIDHDYGPGFVRMGEQIPAGWGVAARALIGSHAFVQLEFSRGAEQRQGAICGGFIYDPQAQCVPEDVAYSGGLAAISTGWPGHVALGSRWSLGLRPQVGVAFLWVHENGQNTGRSYSEMPFTLRAGISGDVGYFIPDLGFSVVAVGGLDYLKPLRTSCEDCRQVVRDALPQFVYGVGLSWRPR
jgi:hypothetical protein